MPNITVNVGELYNKKIRMQAASDNLKKDAQAVINYATQIVDGGWSGDNANLYLNEFNVFKPKMDLKAEAIEVAALALNETINIVTNVQDDTKAKIAALSQGIINSSAVAGTQTSSVSPAPTVVQNAEVTEPVVENTSTQVSQPTNNSNMTVQSPIAAREAYASAVDYKYGPSGKGSAIINGSDSLTVNDMLTKIKVECEKQGIGEHWTDAAAISLWETGTYQAPNWNSSSNNFGGLSPNGSDRLGFSGVDEGVTAFVSNLKRNYIDQGLTNVSSMASKYCPPNSAGWASNVQTMKNQVERSL